MNYQQRSQGQPLKRVGLLFLIFATLCFFQRTVSDEHRFLRALATVQGLEERAYSYTPPPGLDGGGNNVPEPSPEGTVPPPTLEPTSPEPTMEPSATITQATVVVQQLSQADQTQQFIQMV